MLVDAAMIQAADARYLNRAIERDGLECQADLTRCTTRTTCRTLLDQMYCAAVPPATADRARTSG